MQNAYLIIHDELLKIQGFEVVEWKTQELWFLRLSSDALLAHKDPL